MPMTIEKEINKKIDTKDDDAIVSLFKPIGASILKNCVFADLNPPFDCILEIQNKYNLDGKYDHLIEIFKHSLSNLGVEFTKTHRFIINSVFINRKSDIETVKLFVEYFKVLHFKEKYETTVFLLNYIIYLYFKLENYKMSENLLLVLKDSVIKTLPFYRKDLVFFNFYRGVVAFLKDDFAAAYTNIKFSFKYGTPAVRDYISCFYFLISFLNGRKISPGWQQRYNFDFRFFEDVYNGKISPKDSADQFIKDLGCFFARYVCDPDIRIYDFIIRAIDINLPSICFYYILKKVFREFSTDCKLEIKYIIAYLNIKHFKMTYDEVINEIAILISNRDIKAYISLSKNVIVFSKSEPFPVIHR